MNCIHVPQILMPNADTDLYKWSVVACDQFTSQPEYWKKTERKVGDAPSTLKLTLPEVYLESEDEQARVDAIHATMEQYLTDGTLQEYPKGFMLVERSFGKKYARNGLIVEVDLETYEYKKGANSLTRPTEMTVEVYISTLCVVGVVCQHVSGEFLVVIPHIHTLGSEFTIGEGVFCVVEVSCVGDDVQTNLVALLKGGVGCTVEGVECGGYGDNLCAMLGVDSLWLILASSGCHCNHSQCCEKFSQFHS